MSLIMNKIQSLEELRFERTALAWLLVVIEPSETLSKSSAATSLGITMKCLEYLVSEGFLPCSADASKAGEVRIPRNFVSAMLNRMAGLGLEEFVYRLEYDQIGVENPLYIQPEEASAVLDAISFQTPSRSFKEIYPERMALAYLVSMLYPAQTLSKRVVASLFGQTEEAIGRLIESGELPHSVEHSSGNNSPFRISKLWVAAVLSGISGASQWDFFRRLAFTRFDIQNIPRLGPDLIPSVQKLIFRLANETKPELE